MESKRVNTFAHTHTRSKIGIIIWYELSMSWMPYTAVHIVLFEINATPVIVQI